MCSGDNWRKRYGHRSSCAGTRFLICWFCLFLRQGLLQLRCPQEHRYLELPALPPPPLGCWDYRLAPPWPIYILLEIQGLMHARPALSELSYTSSPHLLLKVNLSYSDLAHWLTPSWVKQVSGPSLRNSNQEGRDLGPTAPQRSFVQHIRLVKHSPWVNGSLQTGGKSQRKNIMDACHQITGCEQQQPVISSL